MKASVGPGSYSRALLTFHHILSSKKKKSIREGARDLQLYGICKVGYPGVLAIEGQEERVSQYVKQIKSLRWASCTLANLTLGLSERELRMIAARRTPSESPAVEMVEKMADVGAYMRATGLEDWWRKSMGYSKGGSD